MKGKSLVTSLLTMAIAVIGQYSSLLTDTAQVWLGSIAMLVTAVLNSSIFISGGSSWPTGWNWVLWTTNIAGILTLWLTQMADSANPLIPVAVVNGIIAGINIFLTTFVKSYSGTGGESALGGKS